MKARLFCKTGILSGKAIEIGEAATIGKAAENDLELNAPFISNQHARIYFDKKENCYFLEDLGSRNGTKLDNTRVAQKEKLGNLHVISFPGNPQPFDFIFQVIDAGAPKRAIKDEPESARESETRKSPARSEAQANAPRQREETDRLFGQAIGRTMIDQEVIAFPNLADLEKESSPRRAAGEQKKTIKANSGDGAFAVPAFRSEKTSGEQMSNDRARTSQPAFVLEIKAAEKEIQTFSLREGENLIGRSQQCPISIDDPSLSRQHALLTLRAGKATLRDLESRNHTYVDKKLISSEVEVDEEVIMRFGTVEAVIRKA